MEVQGTNHVRFLTGLLVPQDTTRTLLVTASMLGSCCPKSMARRYVLLCQYRAINWAVTVCPVPGRHTGTAHAKQGQVQLQLAWSDPFSGSGTDEFQLNSPNELSVRSTIKVQGGEAIYTTIYNRKQK